MWTVIRREFGRTAEPRQLRSMKDASLLEYVGNPAITSLQRTQQRALKHKASERPDTDEKQSVCECLWSQKTSSFKNT